MVVGWRRGGTSCLMSALREAGIPVVGFKYPYEFHLSQMNKETLEVLRENMVREGGVFDPISKVVKRNPSGFWEVPSIALHDGLQEKHSDFGNEGNVVKITMERLANSNPKLIHKVILILRNPHQVITSRMYDKEIKDEELFIRTNALGMLYNFLVALRWLKGIKIPYKIIHYEDLISEPQTTLLGICDFIGRGNPYWGSKVIDPKLNRSKPIENDCQELKDLMEFYKGGDDPFAYNLSEMHDKIIKMKEEYESK